MKKIVNVVEVEGEGLVKLLNERVTLFCWNYFYTGILSGVNKDDVLLTEASIVYETGNWDTKNWANASKLPGDIYVRTAAIEAYGLMK